MNLVVAGGGTGGHLFPGLALAEEFIRQAPGTRVTFIGAKRGLEMTVVPPLGYDLVVLPVRGVMGSGIFKGFGHGLTLLWGAMRAFAVLGRVKPDLVIGVGGYASVPAVLAAFARGVPCSILEQNVMPGRANRILAHLVRRIYQGFGSRSAVFPTEKTVISGNPIRPEALPPPGLVRPPWRKNLLILGGSQGARQINELALDFVPRLKERFPDLSVTHQTGPAHEERVRLGYGDLEGVTVVPFIKEIARAYSDADLCVSRAGAMAVSELAASGLPAILIPYPQAAGGHQDLNARWFEERGGAVTVYPEEATGDLLFEKIVGIFETPGVLAEMADSAAKAGVRDAAARIVRGELERLGKKAE
ncbi:MAG: undecaprenyldiphospho-muramoylpentapeptide beta-N-acetylglucosaminyltransferase [Proteobacteria bacterium]|nr:undecaprenyldiphospho-muramoylpentapeptide beta-N-acetylglucosaminyltransferase [Pseudomonadota bacterium]